MKLFFISILLIFISSCATMSKEQCQVGDWKGMGLIDGQQGHLRTRLASHQEACAEHGINVDKKQYLGGYKEGLKLYCNIDSAYELGKSGQYYRGVCNSKFTARYKQGKEVYDLETELSNIKNQIETARQQLSATENSRAANDIKRQLRSLKKKEKVTMAKLVYLKGKNGEGIDSLLDVL